MGAFTGTGRLLRLALRRDRIVLPVTIIIAVALVAGSAPALAEVYNTPATINSYVASGAPSVVGRVFQGPMQGATLGSILIAEVFLFGAIILGIMSAFIITRHTRHNEELGAAELLGAGVVGRSAPLSAAVVLALLANGVAVLALYASLAIMPDFDQTGSLYMSLALGGFGLAMAGVAAVTAQLSDYRRGANLLAMATLGVFFIVRGFGDALGELSADGLSVTSHWLSWLSPMGWAYLVLPYADNRVMPLLLLGGLYIVLTAIGYALLYRRDVGSSLFASRPGRARASALLSGTWGLAARLQWSNLLAWGAGFVVSGVLIAVVVNDYQQTFEENELFRQLLASTGSTTASFLESIIALMYPLMATFLAGYAVAALIKLSDEETSGRLEALLATATGRTRWLWSHVGSTMIGSVLVFAAMGVAGALGFAVVSGTSEVDPSMIWWASLIIVPAMLVFISGIALVYALWGRWVKPFAWTWYAYCAFIGSFAGIFSWPDWVTKLSPFDYTPAYPSDTVEWSILAALVAVAVVMGLVATVVFRQRDITTE